MIAFEHFRCALVSKYPLAPTQERWQDAPSYRKVPRGPVSSCWARGSCGCSSYPGSTKHTQMLKPQCLLGWVGPHLNPWVFSPAWL